MRGRGQIIGSSSSQDFVNHGTIVADDPAGALDLFIGITNRGVLSAAAGGTLGINAFIDQSAGGRLVADNATIAPPAGGFGYTVFQGRMETVGAGRFAIPAGKAALLEGPTVAGLVEIEAGGSLDLGSFVMTNDGSIVVNSDAGSAVARFRVNGGAIGGPIEIDGTGTITLAGTPAIAADRDRHQQRPHPRPGPDTRGLGHALGRRDPRRHARTRQLGRRDRARWRCHARRDAHLPVRDRWLAAQ